MLIVVSGKKKGTGISWLLFNDTQKYQTTDIYGDCRDKRYKHSSVKHLSDLLGAENYLVSADKYKGLGGQKTILEKAEKEAHRFAFKSAAEKAGVKETECSDRDFHQ